MIGDRERKIKLDQVGLDGVGLVSERSLLHVSAERAGRDSGLFG